jgi:hypothetical protein
MHCQQSWEDDSGFREWLIVDLSQQHLGCPASCLSRWNGNGGTVAPQVIRVGVVYRLKISPPTPMMATSSGTRRPERWTAVRLATAITSLATKIAVGGGSISKRDKADDNVISGIIPRFLAHVNRFSIQNEIRHNLPLTWRFAQS